MVPNIQSRIVLFSITYLFALKWFQILVTNINSARGVMVIVAGCGHDDTSSNPGRT